MLPSLVKLVHVPERINQDKMELHNTLVKGAIPVKLQDWLYQIKGNFYDSWAWLFDSDVNAALIWALSVKYHSAVNNKSLKSEMQGR